MQLSANLKSFLENHSIKNTLQNLLDTLQEKSFGIIIFLLMMPAALPIPTFGITHILEAVAVLVAFQMVLVRQNIWLPSQILHTEVKWMSDKKFVMGLVGFVEKIERFSKPRLQALTHSTTGSIVTGVILMVFSSVAFVAPLATGLDTLPALGAVFIALSLVFGDGVLWIVGLILGVLGTVLVGLGYFLGLQIFGQVWQHVIGWF